MKYRLPFCVKCNKLVDKISAYDNIEDGKRHFKIECHGSSEEVEFDMRRLYRKEDISFGLAFDKKELSPGSQEV